MKKFKKGIALILTSIMMLSPVSVFAGSDNTLAKPKSGVLDKTLFLEEGSGMTTHNLKSENKHTDDIEYVVDGSDLNIKISSATLIPGDMFKVRFENAEWFFRHSSGSGIKFLGGDEARLKKLAEFIIKNSEVEITAVGAGGKVTAINKNNIRPLISLGMNSGVFQDLISLVNLQDALVNSNAVADNPYNYTAVSDFNDPDVPDVPATGTVGDYAKLDLIYPTSPATPGATTLRTEIAARFATDAKTRPIPNETDRFNDSTMLDGIYNINNLAYKGSQNEVSTYDPSVGIYLASSRTYIRFDSNYNIIYTLSPSHNNDEAVVLMHKAYSSGTGTLDIPLVALSKDEGDIRIIVESNGTAVSNSTLRYSDSKKSQTAITIAEKDLVNSKYAFPVPDLFIKESATGVVQNGVVYISAPYGFTFMDPTLQLSSGRYARVLAEADITFKNVPPANTPTIFENKPLPNPRDNVIYFADDRINTNNFAKDVIRVDLRKLDIKKSERVSGGIIIQGLNLVADDHAPYGDVSLSVESGPYNSNTGLNQDAGVSKVTVKIGSRIDWKVLLELKTGETVPTIISGRYEPLSSGTKFDHDHRAAKVVFSEKVVASWWALRESEFKLTDGVKFRRVDISDEKNFDYTGKNTARINGSYIPKPEKQGYVTLDAQKLRITDLAILREKTAYFEMYVWVSVEPGFSGDVKLIPGGNELLEAVTPLTIAKVLAPVSIEATVTDVKIGYQWQKVADFNILETAAGALERGKEMYLFIDDGITSSDRIALAQEFVPQLNTDSNMAITAPTTRNGAISFLIDRASYSKPATIKFSNVYVKIDRTVPESNNRPYKLVAGGTAVAANYYENAKLVNLSSSDPVFTTKGIGADFINVITPATGGDAVSATVVKVTIGSKVVKIGRNGEKEITMDTEAYVSPTSNSTMVPVRFVSQAFGIPDAQVVWDNEKRTVTIYNGARIIQFKIGTSDLTINGVTSTMFSPDVPPIKVVAEIKDDRSFLPFRALGNALGVTVDWDANTKTAIFNPELSTSTTNTVTVPVTP